MPSEQWFQQGFPQVEQFRRTGGDSTTNQRQFNHGRWPEANVGQQYRKGLDR